MAPKIFLTGVTGYIGGTVFAALVEKHPEYQMTVLLRSVPDGFETKYPNVNIVRGDFDAADVLEEAAANADIVIHCGASDHAPAVSALLRGLSARSAPAFAYYLHLGGTAIVSDVYAGTHFGELNPEVWSDVAHIGAITTLPAARIHRPTDALVQAAASARVRTAIVCPPDIYGAGAGPGRTQSFLVPLYAAAVRARGRPFVVGAGANVRSWCSLADVVRAYLLLVEDAAAGGARATWGREGYYFTASSEVRFAEFAQRVGEVLVRRGLVGEAAPESVGVETVAEMEGGQLALYMFASNSRSRADRLRALGWEPAQTSIWEGLEADVVAGLEKEERSWGAAKIAASAK